MKRQLLVSFAFVLVLAAIAFAADDPFAGMWELNVAKSALTGPPPSRMTVKYEIQGDVLKYVYDAVDAQGKPFQTGGTFIIDGTDRANPSPKRKGVSSSTQRIDAYTITGVTKKDGQQINTRTEVVSMDGKTLTITLKGKDPQGQLIDRVVVFEKKHASPCGLQAECVQMSDRR